MRADSARRIEFHAASISFSTQRASEQIVEPRTLSAIAAIAAASPGDAIANGYAEACTLDAWAGYLLDAGASRDETRLVEQKTARLMEGLRG